MQVEAHVAAHNLNESSTPYVACTKSSPAAQMGTAPANNDASVSDIPAFLSWRIKVTRHSTVTGWSTHQLNIFPLFSAGSHLSAQLMASPAHRVRLREHRGFDRLCSCQPMSVRRLFARTLGCSPLNLHHHPLPYPPWKIINYIPMSGIISSSQSTSAHPVSAGLLRRASHCQ